MRKKKLIFILSVALLAAVVVFGGIGLRALFMAQVDKERDQQLGELSAQVIDTFGTALHANWESTLSAEVMLLENTYADEDAILQEAQYIQTVLNTAEKDCTYVLVGEDGVCYDAEGEKGVWGDFDRVSDAEARHTFISDSVTYDGAQWAFAKRLDTPVTTDDGDITIDYVVLLRPVDSLAKYYTSVAYEDVSETYILEENGTRMYDNVSESDTIDAYNVYKALRASADEQGTSFDDVTEMLAERGVACATYKKDGKEYIYSLAWEQEYEVVLLLLIPTEDVAVNTVAMVTSIMRTLLIAAAVLFVMGGAIIVFAMRLGGTMKLNEQKEQSLREMEAANARLAEMNDALTNANKAAKSALDIAQSANHAKSRFLSNMSHDIRTPLNAIIGFIQLLKREPDDPEKVKTYTEKIDVSSKHLLNLINDILDMSRIESGKTTLQVDAFAVEDLAGEMETIIGPQARQKNQQLVVDTEQATGLRVMGDRFRLSQILINLLSNAVKYTPEGGTIWFRIEQQKKQTAKVTVLRFYVRDNGIGMSEKFTKRVFEPFEREQTSTTSGIQGTGLGMAITKNLVDLMGGIIMVDSKLGEGTTFTLEMTFALPDANAANSAANGALRQIAAEDAALLEGVLTGKKFLVAEDNEINAEIISELLTAENASCTIAKNGEEAVAMFAASAPGDYDAIFMDIQMPVMDGYAAAKKIRACDRADAITIPMAAMTANAFSEDVQKAIEAGMNAHISKPVDMIKLKEFVANFCA